MDVFFFGGDFSLLKGFFMTVIVAGMIALKIADNIEKIDVKMGVE